MRTSRGGKGSRYVEVPLDAFDHCLRELGFAPDESTAIREGSVEVSYSKVIQTLILPCPNRFIISVQDAATRMATGKRLIVAAQDIETCAQGALQTARLKCTEAYIRTDMRSDKMRVVSPKGKDSDVLWLIVHDEEVRGRVLVRVYTSITTKDEVSRGVGEDAIRVCVVYQNGPGPGGQVRGLGHENRVNRTGSIEGVMQRVSERIVEAEGLTLAWCERCSGPAYADSGNCIDPNCRIIAAAEAGKECKVCGGPAYADSGKCMRKTCLGHRVQHRSWAQGGPCQKCGGDTYTDSGKCIDATCRVNGGRAAPKPEPECDADGAYEP